MFDYTPPTNVEWILNALLEDYRGHLQALTDDELRYCLTQEKRKSGLARLRAEARRRGLEVPT